MKIVKKEDMLSIKPSTLDVQCADSVFEMQPVIIMIVIIIIVIIIIIIFIIVIWNYYLAVMIVIWNYYLAVPPSTLGHSQEDSINNSMLITAF